MTVVSLGCSDESPRADQLAQVRTAVISGANSTLGQWPWVVRISPGLCGGALIAPDWVLTAAHCLLGPNDVPIDLGQLTLYFGEVSRSQNESPSEWTSGVDFGHIDPGFNRVSTAANNDFALLHLLSPPPPLAANIEPIRLAAGGDSPGVNAVVAGWGYESFPSGSFSDTLKYASVPIVANANCDAAVQLPRNLLSNEQCMGSNDGDPGTCYGDSGSPYAVERTTGAWEVVGIVSWGPPSCDGYEVAARVSTRLDFIRKHVVDVAVLAALNGPLL